MRECGPAGWQLERIKDQPHDPATEPIVVTAYTDPSWTPLVVAIRAW